MRVVSVILFCLLLLIPVYGKMTSLSSGRSIEEKLGYLPSKEIMKIAALDHKFLISEWLCFKVIVYYGGKIETEAPAAKKNIEYANMYRFLDTATYIDPYNIDAYYFTQAIFTWELGKIADVNVLLERGRQYRTWDFYLPFFLGFNNFYFLKDYKQASFYMEQAAKITGDPFFANLAARFLYESDDTEIAVSFLKFMIDRTWNEKVKKTLQTRLRALETVDFLEKGVRRFEGLYRKKPGSMEEMVRKGIIDKLPEDPYGGEFYMDEKGKIRTTSKFAFGGVHGDSNKDRRSQ